MFSYTETNKAVSDRLMRSNLNSNCDDHDLERESPLEEDEQFEGFEFLGDIDISDFPQKDHFYGGFPQLSRIFPPISSSSSTTSSTDSDIQVTRKFRFHRKLCACICIAVLFVGIGAAVGIYFGYQLMNLTPPMEQTFRGMMTIVKGDVYSEKLAKSDSKDFIEKSLKYKKLIDSLYKDSVVKNAFLGSEILAFDGDESGHLSVFFNIHIDTHKIRFDSGDLYIIFADAIRNLKGVLDGNLVVNQDTLEIQERSMAFLYLPATERSDRDHNYVEMNNLTHSSEVVDELTSTQRPSIFTSSTKRVSKYEVPSNALDDPINSGSIHSIHVDRIDSFGSHGSSSDSCAPMSIDFCINATSATKQRRLDDLTVLQLAAIVESQCYPFAAHFLCSWGIACHKDDDNLDNNGKPLLPCRDYCDEFMANCGHKLPRQIKDKMKCGGEWKGQGSCITKPGCVAKLYESGQKQRICDGVMDCIDFSDELHCPYCPPGNFHCGAGKECIPPEKKCDGVQDCPNSSDEKACLTLAPSSEAAGYVHQYFNEGYLFVHDQGRLGKLCVERNETQDNSLWAQESQLLLDNIGSSACELLGFRKVAFVRIQPDGETDDDKNKDGTYVRIQEPGSSTEVTFSAGVCPSKKVLYVGCNHLECGQRPSHQRKSKGWAGHGDWPWHAALFKDGEHVCDATLVTSQWLLTSDYCFSGQSKARWTVHFGRVRMSTVSPWQQERRVVGMVKSPLGDHLVLIKMASPVIFSDFARHICLPDEPEGRTGLGFPSWEKLPSKCVRLGWSKEDELVETAMHQLSQDSCHQVPYSQKKIQVPKPTQLCFENDPPGRDCLKEIKVFSGGPVYCQNDDTKEWALAGITPSDSRPKCGIEKYKVSSIGGSTEWILKTIEALTNNS